MRTALAIARKDLRQRIRDRSAIVVGVIAPVVIAGLMSLAFNGVNNFHFTLGLVELDHGPVAAQLVKALDAPQLRQVITVQDVATPARAASEIRSGVLAAALVIPVGFSAAVTGEHPEPLTTLTSNNATIAGDVATSVAGSFVAQVNADRLAFATAVAAGAPKGDASRLIGIVARLRIPLQAVESPIGAHELKVISYYSPGMAIFFLLFTISYTARSFFVDRSQGMIERMRAAPVRPVEILLGKALSVFVYGVVSLATIGVVTTAAFGADWGAPLPAALLGLALVFSVICLTALVIGIARTQRQAEGIASIIIFGLALLGGDFFFISSAPSTIKHLALLTPNGWAIRGFTDLATIGGGLGTIVEPVVAILVISAVVGAFALSLARRAVTS
ncbi:MAG: ABC transporter permease [Acidimicrobiales bacterium]|jgi:ABC-2 type transport system permease protein